MLHRTTPLIALALTLTLSWAGLSCGDESSGTAPEISNLVYAPDSGSVNQTLTIVGSLDFYDADSDVMFLEAAFTGPVSASVGPQQTQGTLGLEQGQLAFQFVFQTPVAGSYQMEVWVIDASSNRSNRLSGPITISQ